MKVSVSCPMLYDVIEQPYWSNSSSVKFEEKYIQMYDAEAP